MQLHPQRKSTFAANLRQLRGRYPRQFWLLFWGTLINVLGVSMIWPFLTIYMSEKLLLPLTAVAGLISLNSAATLVFSFIAGPVSDRLGRKGLMVGSLLASGLTYLMLSQAQTFAAFAALMLLRGATSPLYSVPADAMLADLVPEEQRPDAYALLRMSKNLGIAVGPAIGGFITATSYSISFSLAAVAQAAFGLLILFLAHETLPKVAGKLPATASESRPIIRLNLGGYDRILRDRVFVAFTVGVLFTQICAALIWVLMAVYAKQNFALPESQFGLIATTNAVLVVVFQLAVTQMTKRFPAYRMLALGALIYAVGTGSVVLARGFWGFWLSMVIITLGELVLVPTADTHAANLAPAEMRGRYLSIYQLSWGAASGIGPVYGGVLNDIFGPPAIWLGGMLSGLLGASLLNALGRRSDRASLKPVAEPVEPPAS
jgi:MFS family permease